MNTKERLSQIFSNPIFIEANKDKNNFEDVYTAVLAYDDTITRAELEVYLHEVSKALHEYDSGELTEDDLSDVAGAGGITFFAVISVLGGCYKLGEGLGKFIYNITHR